MELVLCDEVGHSNLAQEAKDPQLEVTGVSFAEVMSLVGHVGVDVNLYLEFLLQLQPESDGLLLLEVLATSVAEDVDLLAPKEVCWEFGVSWSCT